MASIFLLPPPKKKGYVHKNLCLQIKSIDHSFHSESKNGNDGDWATGTVWSGPLVSRLAFFGAISSYRVVLFNWVSRHLIR